MAENPKGRGTAKEAMDDRREGNPIQSPGFFMVTFFNTLFSVSLGLCSRSSVTGEMPQHRLWVKMGARERGIGRSAVPGLFHKDSQ